MVSIRGCKWLFMGIYGFTYEDYYLCIFLFKYNEEWNRGILFVSDCSCSVSTFYRWSYPRAGIRKVSGISGQKAYFPRQIMPIDSLTVYFINLLISFAIIYSILLVSGCGIDLKLQRWLIPVWLIEYMLALGSALLLSAVEAYFRDIEHIVTVLIIVWMYVTPMLYSIESIPEKYLLFFIANPLLYIIGMYQQVLYHKVAPDIDEICN